MGEDVQVVELEATPVQSATIALLEKATIDAQVSTAKAFPRSVKRFQTKLQELACLNESIAEACIFALPRAGKTIEGPSIRFAEMALSAYGNSRSSTRVVNVGRDTVTAQGVFHDLENNIAISVEVERRITNKDGKRFNADMIVTTGNAACSIALRNAILRGIPKALCEPIYQEARKVVAGDSKTMANRRAEALAYLQKLGVTEKMVFATLGVVGTEDITSDHLVSLRAAARAIRDGEATVEEAFIDPDKKTDSPNGAPGPGSTAPGMAGLKAAVGAGQPAAEGEGIPTSEPDAPAPAPPPAFPAQPAYPTIALLGVSATLSELDFATRVREKAAAHVSEAGLTVDQAASEIEKLVTAAKAEHAAARKAMGK